jgi:hypothetical protein
MFFRRKPPTLQSLDARVTALELLFEARRVDAENAAPGVGPRPVSDGLEAALASLATRAGFEMPALKD